MTPAETVAKKVMHKSLEREDPVSRFLAYPVSRFVACVDYPVSTDRTRFIWRLVTCARCLKKRSKEWGMKP